MKNKGNRLHCSLEMREDIMLKTLKGLICSDKTVAFIFMSNLKKNNYSEISLDTVEKLTTLFRHWECTFEDLSIRDIEEVLAWAIGEFAYMFEEQTDGTTDIYINPKE